MKKNLIYIVAFDAKGHQVARVMAKLLTSSILKTLWSGDVYIFRNEQTPLFPVGRPGVKEIYCNVKPWISTKKEDVEECLRESLKWRFLARNYIDASEYNFICYLDSDCLALRNLDHLFDGDSDILIQRETGRKINDPVFNGYLSKNELSHLTQDGINAGSIAVRGTLFQEFMEEWENVYNSQPSVHERFRDQTALNRLLLDTQLRVRPFERGEIRFPFHLDIKYSDYRSAALLHMVGEGQTEKIDLAFAFYMASFYNDGRGLFLDFLEM